MTGLIFNSAIISDQRFDSSMIFHALVQSAGKSDSKQIWSDLITTLGNIGKLKVYDQNNAWHIICQIHAFSELRVAKDTNSA